MSSVALPSQLYTLPYAYDTVKDMPSSHLHIYNISSVELGRIFQIFIFLSRLVHRNIGSIKSDIPKPVYPPDLLCVCVCSCVCLFCFVRFNLR